MGNQLCCGERCEGRKLSWETRSQKNKVGSGASWTGTSKKKHTESCPLHFQKKNKTGSQARQMQKQQQQPQPQPQQKNDTKGPETPGHTYEQVLEHPKSQGRSPGLWSEESTLHYADIQVCSRTQPRSARGMKHLQSEDTTEYATLRFPRATPHYDSKNGTLV